MKKLYEILEGTNGWSSIATNLTEDECKQRYDDLVYYDGVNPQRLKIIRVNSIMNTTPNHNPFVSGFLPPLSELKN